MEQIIEIGKFILSSFIHIWPYLVITIPLAVVIRFLNFSKYINQALSKSPFVSILLATAIGAFSPFCSCGVIPVIASLLIGGVPVAPIMSFWLASPSMDPEIFFLSVSVLGWKLAIWRLASTFLLSLGGGIITHYLVKKGWLREVLKKKNGNSLINLKVIIHWLRQIFSSSQPFLKKMTLQTISVKNLTLDKDVVVNCSCSGKQDNAYESPKEIANSENNCCDSKKEEALKLSLGNLRKEIIKATLMVSKFMAIAFFINALINLYVPVDFLRDMMTDNEIGSIFIFSALGIPFYTSNISALPLVQGLLSLGLHPGAALAFLISGPTTTLPAMIAVYGIASRKVFSIYISLILFGSAFFGILFYLLA